MGITVDGRFSDLLTPEVFHRNLSDQSTMRHLNLRIKKWGYHAHVGENKHLFRH